MHLCWATVAGPDLGADATGGQRQRANAIRSSVRRVLAGWLRRTQNAWPRARGKTSSLESEKRTPNDADVTPLASIIGWTFLHFRAPLYPMAVLRVQIVLSSSPQRVLGPVFKRVSAHDAFLGGELWWILNKPWSFCSKGGRKHAGRMLIRGCFRDFRGGVRQGVLEK